LRRKLKRCTGIDERDIFQSTASKKEWIDKITSVNEIDFDFLLSVTEADIKLDHRPPLMLATMANNSYISFQRFFKGKLFFGFRIRDSKAHPTLSLFTKSLDFSGIQRGIGCTGIELGFHADFAVHKVNPFYPAKNTQVPGLDRNAQHGGSKEG